MTSTRYIYFKKAPQYHYKCPVSEVKYSEQKIITIFFLKLEVNLKARIEDISPGSQVFVHAKLRKDTLEISKERAKKT